MTDDQRNWCKEAVPSEPMNVRGLGSTGGSSGPDVRTSKARDLGFWWGGEDSNLRPTDYESAALTD
jgi:hypothetical protein